MNSVYDQINLNIQNGNHHLIAFNGQDLGIVRFQRNFSLLNSCVWRKVKACINGISVNGYLDVSKLINNVFLSKIANPFSCFFYNTKSCVTGHDNSTANAKVINDLVVQRLLITPSDKAFLSSLMHLGINYNQYIANPREVINRFFIDTVTEEKMNNFYFHLISSTYQEKLIIKKLICDFISTNINIVFFIGFWPKPLFYDKDIILAAVKQNGRVLKYAPDCLKNDMYIVLSAINKDPMALEFASDNFKNYKKLVLYAVKKNGMAIKHASCYLKDDKDVALTAIDQNINVFEYISDTLKCNKSFILEAVKVNIGVVNFISDNLKNDNDFMLSLLNLNGNVLFYLPDKLKSDKKLVLAALTKYWKSISYASVNLQKDQDVILAATVSLFLRLVLVFPINYINTHKVKQLIEGYIKFKESKYLYSQEVNNYIRNIINNKTLKADKIKRSIEIKLGNRCDYFKDIMSHLELEVFYLKTLNLNDPSVFRIIFLMSKEIISYRNEKIRKIFFDVVSFELYSKETTLNFIDKLSTISGLRKNLIIPSILLSTLNISKEKQTKLCEILKMNKAIFKNKFNPHLQNLINLEKKIKKVRTELGDERIVDIIIFILNSLDNNEILTRINLLVFILDLNPEKVVTIEDFSSDNLLKSITDPLVKINVLENTKESISIFLDIFFKSRIPHAIFTYVGKFIDDKIMLMSIKVFINNVIKGTYLSYRHECNSHKHLLSYEQKLIWETEFSKKLDSDSSKETIFNPEIFLRTKLIIDKHGNSKLDRIIGVIESGVEATISFVNEVEKLCIDLLGESEPIKQLNILKILQRALNNDEYKDVEFRNDVKAQIILMEKQFKSEVGLTIKDTEDWQDLFFCGIEVAGSCQKVDGYKENNKCLLGYVLDGKIRMIKIEKEDGTTVARSIIKIMKDSTGNPALLLERIYSDSLYISDIKSFAKQKSISLGINLYEFSPIESIRLYSEGNVAPFEYEDSGEGVTSGFYTVNAKLIKD